MFSISQFAAKSPADLAIEDLEGLVSLEAPESQTLELKQDLQTPPGSSGWRSAGKLHARESEALAKEIVAFANSNGGRIILGIAESKDHPKRAVALAEPFPSVSTLTERLRDAFHGLISPPIPNLVVMAVKVIDRADDGYIVIDVPRTVTAPHGLGAPPQCYWRRDSTSQPMTMMDLQNVFWDARTRRERIDQEIAESRARLDEFAKPQALNYRFTMVSEFPIEIPDLVRRLRSGEVIPPTMGAPVGGVADYPIWNIHEWTFAAFGAEKTKLAKGYPTTEFQWAIDETGVIEVIGSLSMPNDSPSPDLVLDPFDFCATASHLLYLATYIQRAASIAPDRWIVDGELKTFLTGIWARNPGSYNKPPKVNLTRGARFRPTALSLETSAEESFRALESRVWSAFGLECEPGARVDFQLPKRSPS